MTKIAFFSAAFRPFFFGAVFWGIFAVFLWLLFLSNALSINAYFDPLTWHAHELLFGFAGSVILGFLFTASQNWTGKRGLHGWPLFILFIVWLLGRILLLLSTQPSILVSSVDLILFPLAIAMLCPYLFCKSQVRNLIFLVLLLLLFVANLFVHLEKFELLDFVSRKGIYLALNSIVFMIVILGGRVIPFFTSKVLPDWKFKRVFLVDVICLSSTFLYIFADIFYVNSVVSQILALIIAITFTFRIFYNFNFRVLRIPILAILYSGAFWIIAGFILRGLNYPSSITAHALGIGGVGVMIYGFITRVSLAHTGRIIKASKLMILGYLFINMAALMRIISIVVPNINMKISLHASVTFFLFALLVYLIEFTPILFKRRMDEII